jgi:N-acetylmuramoyl-L-alanine amidase
MVYKRLVVGLVGGWLLFSSTLLFSLPLQSEEAFPQIGTPANSNPRIEKRFTIVIDPGHGGEDTGAVGPSGIKEKDVVLDIAKRLKELLIENYQVTVILTRDGDYDLPLELRTEKANAVKADLFISIHTNASRRQGARGAETYIMSYKATDDEARNLAAVENNVLGITNPEIKQNKELSMVLWDLAQTEYLAESTHLAETIQNEFNEFLRLPNRGVKQAPFAVLMGAMMPAVLVEVGFTTNPAEEQRLAQERYRQEIAATLARSIGSYLELYQRAIGNF